MNNKNMHESFKTEILKATEGILKEKNLEYSIDNYEAGNEDDVIKLTDILIQENKITISNDFALVIISGNQYDFEEWRYKNRDKLLNELKELLISKL